eukprot:6480297-Amphidinium_carterae.1
MGVTHIALQLVAFSSSWAWPIKSCDQGCLLDATIRLGQAGVMESSDSIPEPSLVCQACKISFEVFAVDKLTHHQPVATSQIVTHAQKRHMRIRLARDGRVS